LTFYVLHRSDLRLCAQPNTAIQAQLKLLQCAHNCPATCWSDEASLSVSSGNRTEFLRKILRFGALSLIQFGHVGNEGTSNTTNDGEVDESGGSLQPETD
jgi:hypothetical protein